MQTVRIIPCLDVAGGSVVKGINFENLSIAGDPVELARDYSLSGADELVFLDITATSENRKTLVSMVDRCAAEVFIPFTVGGGVSSLEDAKALLRAGADKVSINSSAVRTPDLIRELAESLGSQCVVVAVDVKWANDHKKWEVFINGGKTPTGMDAISWIEKSEKLGAGEILLTSMDRDGTTNGYDLELLKRVGANSSIPIIASGGAGGIEHFVAGGSINGITGLLAASVFHYKKLSVCEVKEALMKNAINVRPCV